MSTGKIPVTVVLLLSFSILTCSIQAKYSGGSGNPNDPYQIASVADLLVLAGDTNDYGKCFVLIADINLDPCLPGGQVFTTAVIAPDTDTSWGFQGIAFTGVFDGAGHKIIRLTIDADGTPKSYLGLFGSINNGEVKNLGLLNVRLVGGSYYTGGLAGNNNGSIQYCSSQGNIAGGNSYSYNGGLVGNNDGSISSCYSAGNVTSGNSSSYLGGLVGHNNGSISKSCSTGNVTGGNNSGRFGGLVGFNFASISNCFATGDVNVGSNAVNIGGLAGQTNYGSISKCYATGDVNGGDLSNNIGGLMGYGYGCTISSSYFLITGGPDNSYGEPLTDEQMKQQSSFVGWDFIETWGIEDNQTYPFLKLTYPVGDLNRDKLVNFLDLAILASHWLEGL